MANPNRYQEMEQKMTAVLILDAGLFLLFLISAGAMIVWLKIVAAVLALLISAASLAFLVLTKELLKERSLWLSTGFFSVAVVIIASLIVAFP